MARSIETIYSLIIAEKEAHSELDSLNSTSATAIWRLWAWITAAVLFTVESMHDLFRIEIETTLQTLKPGTLPWYQSIILAFQYGDALTWSNLKYIYQVIDPSKWVIKQCSVTEGNRGLVIKVAGEADGELVELSTEQETALSAYIGRIKYAGTKVSLVNSPANKLKIVAEVYYDPLILKADGTDITGSDKPVETAIQEYLRNLPFNGRLKRTAIEAAILAVDGVNDVKITSLEHKYGSGSYNSIEVSWIPESGYFKIDTLFPLSNTLTYQANV
jgi:hypothetical protein